MTLRSITLRTGAALTVATIAALSLAGPAGAAPTADRDCADFPDRAAAQAALNADPSDPNRLDRDHDGQACEDVRYPGSGTGSAAPEPTAAAEPTGTEPTGTRPTGTGPTGTGPAGDAVPDRPGHVGAVPAGGIDAGDGSAGDTVPRGSGIAFVLTGFGAVTGAGAACAVLRTRRRPAGTGAGPSVPRPRTAGDDLPSTGHDAATPRRR